MMYILNIASAIKKMPVNELRKLWKLLWANWICKRKKLLFNETFEKTDLLLLTTKLIEKIPNPRNAKEHYQSFIRKKNTKSVKQWKIITYQPKTFENPNIVDINLAISEKPKT